MRTTIVGATVGKGDSRGGTDHPIPLPSVAEGSEYSPEPDPDSPGVWCPLATSIDLETLAAPPTPQADDLASPTDPPRAPTTPEAAVSVAPAPDTDTNLPAGPPTPDGDVGMFAPANDETHEREANKDDGPFTEYSDLSKPFATALGHALEAELAFVAASSRASSSQRAILPPPPLISTIMIGGTTRESLYRASLRERVPRLI